MKQFKRGDKVRILHDNTEGKIVRSWNDGNGNEYLVKFSSDKDGFIRNEVFKELELESDGDINLQGFLISIFASILILLALLWWGSSNG